MYVYVKYTDPGDPDGKEIPSMDEFRALEERVAKLERANVLDGNVWLARLRELGLLRGSEK